MDVPGDHRGDRAPLEIGPHCQASAETEHQPLPTENEKIRLERRRPPRADRSKLIGLPACAKAYAPGLLAEKLPERGHVDDVVVTAFKQTVEPICDLFLGEA